MLILALESSGTTASCALARDGKQIALYTQNSGLTHSTTLLPMIEDMLLNTKTDRRDISSIAVSVGPGSFTGIRIGCSTAKGLSFALGIPCRPVSSLAAMAYSYVDAHTNKIISAEADARNGYIYNALFLQTDSGLHRLCDDRIILKSEISEEGYHICTEVNAWGVILAAEHTADGEPVPVYLRPSSAERVLAERNAT